MGERVSEVSDSEDVVWVESSMSNRKWNHQLAYRTSRWFHGQNSLLNQELSTRVTDFDQLEETRPNHDVLAICCVNSNRSRVRKVN